MQFELRHNIAEVERGLSNFAREQVPFAASRAINAIAADVAAAEERRFRAVLDRPTPFTLRGLMVLRASKRTLAGAVLVRDRQAAYLALQDTGGTRRPKGRAIPVPVKARLNRFGNLPRGGVAKIAAGAHTFSGRPKGGGAPGIYKRLGATASRKAGFQLSMPVAWAARASYRPRLEFLRTARRAAARAAAPAFERALSDAIATARR